MRKTMLTLLIVVLTVSVSFTQSPRSPQRGHHRGAGLPMAELDLSSEQKEKIKEIRSESRAQFEALRGEGGERPDQEAVRKIKENTRAAMEAVLTPAQLEKKENLEKERKAAWESVDKEALKAELKAFHQEKVKPVMSAARTQLDQFISAEDKQSIERLREVMATKSGYKKAAGKVKENNGRPTADQISQRKDAMTAWKTEHAADLEALEVLTKKYAEDIDRIQEKLKPQMESWKQEKRAIAARYMPEGSTPHKAMTNNKPSRKEKTDHKRGGAKRNQNTSFLLMKA